MMKKKNATDGESNEPDGESNKPDGESNDKITSIDISSDINTFKKKIDTITNTLKKQEAELKSKDIDNKGSQQKAYS